jgi:hypothetical protein
MLKTWDVILTPQTKKPCRTARLFLRGSTPAAQFLAGRSHQPKMSNHGDSIPIRSSFLAARGPKSSGPIALDPQMREGYLPARFKAMEFALTAGRLQPS